MEEVYFDLDSPQGSVYATALHPEFNRAVSVESDCKNTLSESIVFEEPSKITIENENFSGFRYQGFDSDEQPPPNILIHHLQDSTTESKQFEDIKLEETYKEIESPKNKDSKPQPKADLAMPQSHIENFNPSNSSNLSNHSDSLSDDQLDDFELQDKIQEQIKEKEMIKDSVLIKSTKLIKSGMFGINNYFVYEIVSYLNSEKFQVLRRFKDFEWLYDNLKENFKGLCIPPLPCKTFKWLQDASEAEMRRIKLEKVLNILLNHSTLKKSQQIWIFLTSADIEFPKLRESMKRPKGKFKYHDLEDAIDQIVSKIQAKMNQIFNFRIIPFNKEIIEIQKYIKNIEIPSFSLSETFATYLNQQEKSLALLQSMQFTHNPQFPKSMHLLKLTTQDQYRKLKVISQQLHIENLKIEALQGALDDYKNVIKKYSELEALVERKRKKAMNYFDDSEKYMMEIKEIKKKIKELEKESFLIEENVKREKMWFQSERDEKFEGVFTEIFDVYLSKVEKEKEFWLNLKHEG